MRPVRSFVIFFVRLLSAVGLVALCAATAAGDIIHLKNGRTIWADQTHETATQVEYSVGDDTYAISKASVAYCEAGGMMPESESHRNSAHGDKDIPPINPTASPSDDSAIADKIIRDGIVDTDALSALEHAGDSASAAAGYYIAGKHEFEKGNFNKAKSYFESGLRLQPDNPGILNYYSALLVRTGNATAAMPYAEQGVRIAPDSPDALNMLGYVQFSTDNDREAIRSWKRSLAIRPDAMIQRILAKAERASSAEADFVQHESSHFTFRYEGKQTSESLRNQLMSTLDAEYDDLVRTLGVAPRNSIPVVLYTSQEFFDVTQAPSWSGAVNDGKLRIPIEDVSSMTPQLARVLKHELAHSFIAQLSGGRCPQWLNEGIAQAVEPKSLASHGRRLAVLFQAQHEIPFNTLEGNFMRFSPIEAILAYDESLAAVQYISDTYGMSDLQRLLDRLGEGSSPEAALRSTIHSDYGQLQSEVGKYLANKYSE